MITLNPKFSKTFNQFIEQAPTHAQAWMNMIQNLSKANTLDPKTSSLIYLGILAAQSMESGIPFHVDLAKKVGASREEIISAILTGLPAVGHKVIQVLPIALETFDNP